MRGTRVAVRVAAAGAVATLSIGATVGRDRPAGGDEAVLAGMVQPEYDARGGLLRPEGYEDWTFVGTSLGISYAEGDEPETGPGQFHSVYMQREAFAHYKRTGKFPERTIFVMTNQPATKKAGPDLINKRGHFAGPATGLEVSVKDSERFEEGWGYFIFSTAGPRKAARAFPTRACYDCHAEHAEDDHVFVQFYSTLEEVKKARENARPE